MQEEEVLDEDVRLFRIHHMANRVAHLSPPRVNCDDTMMKLDKLIESLTTSGQLTLDENELKSLKKICKRGDRYVEHAYGELWDQLNKEHSEIRLSAFQIADVLFQRSHRFRDLVLTQFEEFIQLVTAVNVGTSLPPPKAAAKRLYQTAVKTIHEWNTKYRTSYKKLALGYGYLKTVKKVDFSAAEPRSLVEQRNTDERRRRLEDYRKQRLERLVQEVQDRLPEMHDCVTELRNCYDLLLPNQDFIPDWGEIISSGKTGEAKLGATAIYSGSRGKGVGKKSSASVGRDGSPRTDKMAAEKGPDDVRSATSLNVNSGTEEFPAKEMSECGNSGRLDVSDSNRAHSGRARPESGRGNNNITNENLSPEMGKPGSSINDITKNADEDSTTGEPEPSTSGYVAMEEPDETDSDDSDSDFEEVPTNESDLLRTHGYTDRNFQLQIDVLPTTIRETDDNREIIKNMNDRDKLVASQFMPLIIGWLENLAKLGAEASILKKTIDMKETLSDVRRKYEQLSSRIKFGPSPPLSVAADQSANSEESIGAEPVVPHHCHGNAPRRHGNQPSAPDVSSTGVVDRKSKLLKVAPFVPFDRDLKYWGREDELEPMTISRGQSLHRFLHATEEDEFVPPGATRTTERTMTFVGEMATSDRECRAPLANGKLCPRQDRFKCPFHGKIIDRDACGGPVHAKDKPQFNWGEAGEKQNWQDAEFMEEIEVAKGVDLGSAKAKLKEGKNRKRKYPGLTDLKEAKNTTTKRIEQKVFNKGAMKRVNSALDKMDAKRFDKFGNQFVHTFGK